jgi:hypothetical protein
MKLFASRWIIWIMPALLVLAACGEVNMSGEPEIVSEAEIVSLPTREASPTPQAADEATEADPGPAVAAATEEAADPTSTPSPAPATSVPATDIAPVPTDVETLTVNGTLLQGTANIEPAFADLPLELYVLDAHGSPVGVYQTTAAANGAFSFEDVARASGNVYFVRTDYAGIPQGAQIQPIQGTEDTLDVDITLYERTTDRASVAITHTQMLINYAPINEFGIEVRLDVELINNGDRIVASDHMADRGWPISVEIELPVGAFGIQPMQSEGSERYQVELVDNVPVVEDTWPLRPEQVHTITILYYLPYTSSAVLDQAFGYPVMDATVLVPNDTVEFESEQFTDEGEFRFRVASSGLRVTELGPDEKINPDKDATLIQAYDLLAPLSTDEHLIFTLDGRPTRTVDVMLPTASSSDSNDNTLALVLAAVGAGALLTAGVMMWRQRQTAPPRPTTWRWKPPAPNAGKDALLRAIADLDDAYEAGDIDADAYNERRAILKERLIPLMTEDTDDT